MPLNRLAPILAVTIIASLLLVLIPAGTQAAPDMSQSYLELPMTGEGAPHAVSVSSDGLVIATGFGYNGNLSVYSVASKALLWTATLGAGNNFQVVVSGDGKKVFALDGHDLVYMFSVSGGNVPVWSYSSIGGGFNIVTNYNGSVTMVGAYGAAYLFGGSGFIKSYSAGTNDYMRLALTPDGQRAVGGCGKNIYLFDSGLNLQDQIWVAYQTGSMYQWEPGVAISDDGQIIAFTYAGIAPPSEMVIVKYSTGGANLYYPTYGKGIPVLRLSADGSTVLLRDESGMYLVDTVSMGVLWNQSLARVPGYASISADGSMVAASYDNALRIYGRDSSLPVAQISMGYPYRSVISRDGTTLAVAGDHLYVFRPSIDVQVQAPAQVDAGGTIALSVRATVDGAPLLGANVTVRVNGTVFESTVVEKGSGYYEVTLLSHADGLPSYYLMNVTVSKAGLNSASEQASTLMVWPPSYPNSHDYSFALDDLRSQIGGLQLIVMLLAVIAAVTMVVMVLFVWRSRKA